MRFIIAKQRYTILKHNTPSQAKLTTNPPKKATAPGYWNQTLLLTSQKQHAPFLCEITLTIMACQKHGRYP